MASGVKRSQIERRSHRAVHHQRQIVDQLVLQGDAVLGVFRLQLHGGRLHFDRLRGSSDFEFDVRANSSGRVDRNAFRSAGRKPCFSTRTV